MTNGVNREHGPYRRPVDGSRTVVSSQTTSRWARATVARHACGTERSFLGFTHGCSLARSAVSLSVLSDLSSTLPTLAAQWAADALAAKTGRRLTRPREARSERILSSTPASAARKKGLWCRPYKTRQRQQNHGNRRPPWSSCRRARGQRFAECSHAPRTHAP